MARRPRKKNRSASYSAVKPRLTGLLFHRKTVKRSKDRVVAQRMLHYSDREKSFRPDRLLLLIPPLNEVPLYIHKQVQVQKRCSMNFPP